MSNENRQGGIRALTELERVRVLAINVVLAWVVFIISTGELIPSGDGASIWFLAATSYWFLVLLGTPYFTPPKDSLSTAVVVILLLLPLDFTNISEFQTTLQILKWVGVFLSFSVAILAILSIVKRGTDKGKVCFQLSKHLGRGELLFTIVVVIASLAFYQDSISWMYYILTFWTVMLTIKPVEMGYGIYSYLSEVLNGTSEQRTKHVGTILRIDDPNIVRVALKAKSQWNPETVHIAHMPDGTSKFVLPLFKQVQNEGVIGSGLSCDGENIEIPNSIRGDVYQLSNQEESTIANFTSILSGDDSAKEVAGIVVENSSISSIRFQAVRGVTLMEGMVVFAFMDGKKVHYQILDATTSEETFQQNPFGAHLVTALQLGSYEADRGFKKYPWLPAMNQPVFLMSESATVEETELAKGEFTIGKIPSTPYKVPLVLSDLIEYHTAILGMTGTAKTELAFEIIKKALSEEVKVFCVDFTGEYKKRLDSYSPQIIDIDVADQKRLETLLFAIDAKGFKADAEQEQLRKLMHDTIKPAVTKKIEDFLSTKGAALGIFELAEITNTRTTLRITELYMSAIMEWARNHRRKRKVLIVLEEAHTIIPEPFGSFDANTKWVVERIGQIALQGRKYGVGLMVISQRTALVSKTILSQCHTYFVHALADKTSLDYLSSILTPEHVKAIPNLKFLEFIVHGKALKSERPLLAKRDHDETKAAASAALNADPDEE